MKKLVTLFWLMLGTCLAFSQGCPSAPFSLPNQAAVDAFPSDCINLTVGMTIGVGSGASDITNIDALSNLQTTSNSIFIRNNPGLTNLNGLSNLTSIGLELTIENNDALTDLTGLDNVSFIQGWFHVEGNQNLTSLNGIGPFPTLNSYLYIDGNPSLTDLSALSSLTSVGGFLIIINNNSLTAINGLNSLTQVVAGPSGPGFLYIGDNNAMTTLNGFANLTSVSNNFEIEYNNSLQTLNAFSNLTTVGSASTNKMVISGLPNLLSIDDFGSLTSVAGNLQITDNDALASLAGLTNPFTIGGTLTITGNSSLSQCEAAAVCAHLDDGDPATITGNATGCNSIMQVEIACGLLPVELTYFRGKMEQGDVVLNWQTATEKDNAWFEIEHSSQGTETFSTIGKVSGQGNSNTLQDYSFRHAQPSPGPNYYRLKQVDFDGQHEYSNIVGVTVRGQQELSVYPNPTNGPVFVKGLSSGDERSVVVTDFTGRVVLRKDPWRGSMLDLRELPSGIYHLEIMTNNQKITRRVVKE